jgi:hypothetical protein
MQGLRWAAVDAGQTLSDGEASDFVSPDRRSMKVSRQSTRAFIVTFGASVANAVLVVLPENRETRALVHGSVHAKPDLCDDAEGAFGEGPPACIPNSILMRTSLLWIQPRLFVGVGV